MLWINEPSTIIVVTSHVAFQSLQPTRSTRLFSICRFQTYVTNNCGSYDVHYMSIYFCARLCLYVRGRPVFDAMSVQRSVTFVKKTTSGKWRLIWPKFKRLFEVVSRDVYTSCVSFVLNIAAIVGPIKSW